MRLLAKVRLRENRYARGIPVEKIPSSDWADFALGEETCHGNPPHPFLYHAAIMVGLAEESFSPSAAAKQEGSQRLVLVLGTVGSEEYLQVFAGRLRVAQMKLEGLTLLNDVTDGDGAGLLVRSDEIAYKEIAPLEAASMFIDDKADMQRPMGISPLRAVQRLECVLEAFERRFSAQFIDEIVLGPGHHESLADGTAALRNHRPNGEGPGELDTDESTFEGFFVQDEAIFSLAMSTACETANGLPVGVPIGHHR